jgi:hypothetical protein
VITFAAINIATIQWYPRVWIDEASYSDPSINSVLGKGFRTTAWAGQDKTEFWASNAPLHQYLLIPWLYVLGPSIIAVRGFNIFLMMITSFLLWRFFRVSGLVKDISLMAMCVACLWLSELMSLIYRDGRPDTITLLLATATAVIFYSGWEKKKYVVFIVGLLSVLAGIQLPPFVFILLGMAFLFTSKRRKVFSFGVLYAAGIAAGIAGLLAFLYTRGSAYTFLTQTFASGYTVSGDVAQAVVYNDSKVYSRISARVLELIDVKALYFRDSSSVILMASLTALAAWQLGTDRKNASAWKIVICVLLVPPTILIMGRYPFYYTWMSLSLLLVGCFVGFQKIPGRWRLVLASLMIGAILVTGLPRTLVVEGWPNRDRQQRIREFINQHIEPSDWVYGEHEAYYACIAVASEFFTLSYSGGRGLPVFPEDQRAKLSKLVLYPDQFEAAVKKVGGRWRQVGEMPGSMRVYARETAETKGPASQD